MLEQSFGLTFFLKTPRKRINLRFVYLRITVDGIPKEISTKRKWDVTRWDQKAERAIGTKEDARTLNFFLESMITKVNQYRTELLNAGTPVTAQRIIDFVQGKNGSRAKLVEEFQLHNDEILALVPSGEYAIGTHVRFETTLSHVKNFIGIKYECEDLEFRELNYEFVKAFRSEEHTSELQSRPHLVCRLLLEKKKQKIIEIYHEKKQPFCLVRTRQSFVALHNKKPSHYESMLKPIDNLRYNQHNNYLIV